MAFYFTSSSTKVRAAPSLTHVIASSPSPMHTRASLSTWAPRRVSPAQLLVAAYNWGVWVFTMAMVLSQFFSIVWDTVEDNQLLLYGQSPELGAYKIGGLNDEPYTDRVVACVQSGTTFSAVQVSDVLTWKQMTATDVTVDSVDAYRLVERDGLTISADALEAYSSTCALIAATIDEISGFCRQLGYNVSTQSHLRVVNGIESTATWLIPKSLPVLIMPFWDNAPYARYVIPGSEGSACMFRLLGKFENPKASAALFRGVNRTIREHKTAEWLGASGGRWSNGWYEDSDGNKWHSDVISTDLNLALGIPMRQFDVIKNEELDCVVNNGVNCKELPVTDHWGSKFSTTDQATSITSISISNGRRFGFFLFEQFHTRTVASTYDWETLVSNISISLLLVRWLEAMFALQYGYFTGHSHWHNAGIGCFANSRSFNLLPIVLLPKLKMTLSAFWSVGCEFEGEQKALSEAWFVMYPAILELLLLYFSLLNIVAKVLRRRISDTPFGPTVVFFCLLHYYRLEIATSGWFGIDGRVTPRILSSQFENLKLLGFLTSDVGFEINGNVTSLIVIKLAVLALNALSLLVPSGFRYHFRRLDKQQTADAKIPNGIERILAIRAWNIGGLGISNVYEYDSGRSRKALSGYELVRLGYIMFGGRYLITLEDWEIVSALLPLRRFYRLWNHRVTLFTLQDANDIDSSSPGLAPKTLSDAIQICRLDDPRLRRTAFWKISAKAIQ